MAKKLLKPEFHLVSVERIERRIFLIRREKVMLSTDLADLYGVEPRALVQAVTRNRDRFPDDFMFQLSREEWSALKSQIVILNVGRGKHPKYLPYAFTEQGVAMLSSVLRSKRAVRVNIAIMRAFVRLRQVLATHKDLAQKLAALERKYGKHDLEIKAIFNAIRKLMEPAPPPPSRRIGFVPPEEK